MTDDDVEEARVLVAHAFRPALVLEIRNLIRGDSDTEAWHLFDTILFALYRKYRIDVSIVHEDWVEFFPLMSLVLC